MRIFRFIPILLVFALAAALIAPLPALGLEDPAPGANFVVLVETTSDQVLYAKNENARAYPASLTKIMTALLACEAIKAGEVGANDIVTASDNALLGLDEDSSTANIVSGEKMPLIDLLYCAMVKSANEACNIIGEYISGSIPAFVERMNARARELGCTGTRFTNTHGMPDEGHYTTAWDMYLIMAAAMQHQLFLDISSTQSIEIAATNISVPRVLQNTNALLGDSEAFKGYTYEYARGGKTGHTSAAGYCLASSAVKDDIELIAIVMKAEMTENGDGTKNFGNFSDSVRLFKWGFDNFSYQDIIKKTEVIATLPVSMGSDSNTVSVRPERSVSVLLPNDTDVAEEFEREVTIYNEVSGEKLRAPVQSGMVLGEISLSRGGVDYGTIPLVATGSVELSKGYYMISQIRETLSSGAVKTVIGVLAVLLLLYVILVVRYRILRLRHRMSVRNARKEREARERSELRDNEYYAPELRGARPAQREDDVRVDNFDEDDYYEGDPIGWLPSDDSPQPHDEPYDSAPGDDDDKTDRDYYEEFFK